MNIDPQILDRANGWLTGNYDEETKQQVRELMENDPVGLTDAFYRDLEFGTGGLRGIMGVGTNRMNRYTVGMATQGLANYLKKVYGEQAVIRAAIAYDSRNNNTLFARITANVLSANGIKVFLFDDLRPTPELSFAVRFLKCQTGIVITASHNPREYNGYKVYWNDGSQLLTPHDRNVIEEVLRIRSVDDVKFEGNPSLISTIGEEVDRAFLEKSCGQSLSPGIIREQHDLKIVYTPLHGTGVRLVPRALKAYGFTQIIAVEEQNVISGDFPTVQSPNPEEGAALEMAIQKARETGASLVMGTDPDGDRVGVAVRDSKGDFILLNGNQTASLIIYYMLGQWSEKKKLTGREYIAKTIVTTELLKDIATHFGVETFDVLTGFKYIAELIRSMEGQRQYIGGGEESYGYMIGDFVRDKDAVTSCCMIAETAAWAASQDKTLFDLLIDIYVRFGFYKEKQISVTKKGKAGAEEIQLMMDRFRAQPPVEMDGSRVVRIMDYLTQEEKDMLSGDQKKIPLPGSNVLQFFLEDGSKITVRPSGTEPKIKFYFGIRGTLERAEEFGITDKNLEQRIEAISRSLGL
ncbi:MAG: phospho-sugar mutase [Bacteroidales bacterium]|nr:phospho-sugar mutase [Lentimicrobiaceae bacterium]MDD5694686.1 phospho-sugar mutase [Bacteroidales bacterium]